LVRYRLLDSILADSILADSVLAESVLADPVHGVRVDEQVAFSLQTPVPLVARCILGRPVPCLDITGNRWHSRGKVKLTG
jgi:hypothetical protein